ncbi:MAG: hypothetical protein A3K10_12105 [Bacteroidetes bacterium RIFCSPLOWO2_12_FULL_31_6]|nr:MAG: hypothetical protein A3K10_12105 [Bacteroidetes bacterium RIFCSPLOWO2_12_FULL_31_6]
MFFKTLAFFSFLFVLLNNSIAQDSTSYVIVNEIKVIGNKNTREHIIVRELPFKLGDTIFVNKLVETFERAHSNIFNTSLFNFVTIEHAYFNDIYISVVITVEERWYWWPLPIFEVQETNFNTWWQTRNFDRANYGMFVVKENFRGRKERIAFKVQAGYTEQVGFSYSIPYLNQKQTQGLSISYSYSRNREVNFATLDNKRLFYKDENRYLKKEIYTKATYEFRPKLYNNHSLQISYTNLDVVDSVVFYNADYLNNNQSNAEFLSLTYYLKRDKRNNKAYATKGYFYDFQFTQNGLGVFDKDINNSFFAISYRKYLQLHPRVYLSGLVKGKTSINKQPFYFLGGLGYENALVRGYEYYVVNGEHYGLFKTQLRYGLVENKIFKMNWLPFSKFNKVPLSIYLGTYFDGGYVSENKTTPIAIGTNFLNEKWLFGGGASIDLVSYYDIVFRFEYSFNNLNEQGLFIHFIAPL